MAIKRTLYNFHIDNIESYGALQQVPEFLVDRLSYSTVTTSLTEDSLHAPVLDLDLPAVLVQTSADTYGLWFEAPGSVRDYLKLLERLKVLAMVDKDFNPSRIKDLTRSARRRSYRAALSDSVDVSAKTETAAVLAKDAQGGFEDLMLTVSELNEIVPLKSLPEMKNPWFLPFSVPVHMLQSSSRNHFHLTLEVKLAWGTYERLMHLMAKLGMLEEGYYYSSRVNSGSAIRTPGIKKILAPGYGHEKPKTELSSMGKFFARRTLESRLKKPLPARSARASGPEEVTPF